MTPLIYNLFPRLVGPTTRWAEHAAPRRGRWSFNWLFLNPWHYPGFSGSLYAPKELPAPQPALPPAGRGPDVLDAAPRRPGRDPRPGAAGR